MRIKEISSPLHIKSKLWDAEDWPGICSIQMEKQ
jgi:hypothetical protein